MGLLFNQGQDLTLQAIINKTAPQNLVLCLFKNNYTPVAGTTEANLTEADFTGYSNKTLTGASWSTSGSSPTTASYAQQTFTSSAGQSAQTVYGWYLRQLSSGKAIGGDVFRDNGGSAISYVITNNGDAISFTPSITMNHS